MSEKQFGKALLMTWFKSNNYGTLLQAYATKEIFLKRYGIECYFAKYTPIGKRDWASILNKVFSFKTWKRQFGICYDRFMFKYKKLEEQIGKRWNWVNNFIANYHYANDGNLIESEKDFKNLAEEFTLFISGSDQIWNPQFINERFLLDFVPENKTCISFASSLSTDKISSEKAPIYRKQLKKYDGLTIRESECAVQLANITGKEVNVILDPTLLFGAEQWLQRAEAIEESGYVLVYFLGKSQNARKSALEIAKQRREKILFFPYQSMKYIKEDEIIPKEAWLWEVPPFEWISYINNADIIITDSFHATVFSIMLHKDFYVVEKDNKNVQQNNRILNLLKTIGLTSRFIDAERLTEATNKKEAINWEYVDTIIEKRRKESFAAVDKMMLDIGQLVGGGNEFIE